MLSSAVLVSLATSEPLFSCLYFRFFSHLASQSLSFGSVIEADDDCWTFAERQIIVTVNIKHLNEMSRTLVHNLLPSSKVYTYLVAPAVSVGLCENIDSYLQSHISLFGKIVYKAISELHLLIIGLDLSTQKNNI